MNNYKKIILIFISISMTNIYGTLSSQRKVIGVIKSFNKVYVKIRLTNDTVIKLKRKTVEKKYKKITSGKIVELSISQEEFRMLNQKSKKDTERANLLKRLN